MKRTCRGLPRIIELLAVMLTLTLLAACGESCERYAAIGEIKKPDDEEKSKDTGTSIPLDDKPTSEVFRAAEEKANLVPWDEEAGLIDTGGLVLAEGLMPMKVEMKAGTTVQVEVYHLGEEEVPPKMTFSWWVKTDDGWKSEEHAVECEKSGCEWKKELPVEHDGEYVVALHSDVDTQVQLKLRDTTPAPEGEEGDEAAPAKKKGKKKKGKKKGK